MTENSPTKSTPKPVEATGATDPQGSVLQVERRDFIELVPTDRPRVQSMDGFDDDYTDIVDYIVRCTHKIWDERNIGLIYTHYTHNCVLYGTMGTMYDREAVIHDTIQRLVSFPERRGMATQVVWNGDDKEGFYTSHLVTGAGRYTQNGHLGAAKGQNYVSRTVADCMIHANKIYREWVFSDQMAILRQLGIDPHPYAEKIARKKLASGVTNLDIGEMRGRIGQYPPEEKADTSLAHNETEAEFLQLLHDIWNRKMFGRIDEAYSATAMYHGPNMVDTYNRVSIMHQSLALIGSLPDAAFVPQHIATTPCEEGGYKIAVRWILEGHHLGYGLLETLGEPTGKRIQILGISHYWVKDGKIVEEWRVYDELSLLVQLKLAQLQDGTLIPAEPRDVDPEPVEAASEAFEADT